MLARPPIYSFDYTTFIPCLPLKIQGIATAATPHIPYRSNDFSIFCFCPFKSFCFSYKLFRSLQSSFMRYNCTRTPSRQSGSIFLYSPVRLRIVLLFSHLPAPCHRIFFIIFFLLTRPAIVINPFCSSSSFICCTNLEANGLEASPFI